MALRTARSTADQRLALLKLHDDLEAALESLPGRFWMTRDLEASYNSVLHHLERWAGYEVDQKEVEND